MNILHKIGLAGLLLSIGCFFLEWYFVGLALFFLVAWGWFITRLHLRSSRAIDKALPQLDLIYGGMRYVGKESEVVATRTLTESKSEIVHLEQLCRTKSGTWFKFRFSLALGDTRTREHEVLPCSEDEAKVWLEREPEQYRRFFGEPELA